MANYVPLDVVGELILSIIYTPFVSFFISRNMGMRFGRRKMARNAHNVYFVIT